MSDAARVKNEKVTAVIHVVSVALRAALIFGNITPGDAGNLMKYTMERVPAFVNAFKPLDDVIVACGAGAIALGFPVITNETENIYPRKPSGNCAGHRCRWKRWNGSRGASSECPLPAWPLVRTWACENTDMNPVSGYGVELPDGSVRVNINNRLATTDTLTDFAALTAPGTKTLTLQVDKYDNPIKYGNPSRIEKTVDITYHYPSYVGVVANGATINEAAIKALAKSVEWNQKKTAALTQANQKIVYAYPASYGNLTSIKDGNGFEGIDGYTKQTVTVNGQSYNVYVQNTPATSNSTYTFA